MIECNWRGFLKLYPNFSLTSQEVDELLHGGYVAIATKDRKVFTIRLEVAQSEIDEVDFSKGVRGKFKDVRGKLKKDARKRRKALPSPKR